MNDDFDERDQVLINDLTFSETTSEIRDILVNIRDLLGLLQDFSSQHARLIADAIEPTVEIPEEKDIPPLSVLIAESTSNIRLEWQRNKIVRDVNGSIKSVHRRPIKLAIGGRYPKAIFNVIQLSDRQRFQNAELSLSKIRRQNDLLAEIRKFINRYEYALKSIAPIESSVSSDDSALS